MICECCNNNHTGEYGSGRFCDSKCARSFSTKANRQEINSKVSKKLSGRRGRKQTRESIEKRTQTILSRYGTTNTFTLGGELYRVEQMRKSVKKRTSDHHQRVNNLPFEALSTYQKHTRIRRIGCCTICGISNWQDRKAPLQIDHIDGNNNNNNQDNLRLLCANCHAQTPTFAGRNKQDKIGKRVSDQQLLEALKSFDSVHEALLSCGLNATGAAYHRVLKLLQSNERRY